MVNIKMKLSAIMLTRGAGGAHHMLHMSDQFIILRAFFCQTTHTHNMCRCDPDLNVGHQ